MGILDSLFGRDEEQRPKPPTGLIGSSPQSGDEQAIARYRYMLKTAPPETVEQAHAEAFEKLTPEQRRAVLQELSADLSDAERSGAGMAGRDDPKSLARLATRAEIRRPGTLERSFGGMGGRGGIGMGGMMAGSFLSTIAGVVIGSAIAQSFMGDSAGDTGDAADGGQGGENVADNSSTDAEGDAGGFDGGDFGEI